MTEDHKPLEQQLGEAERIAILYAPAKFRRRYRSLLLLDSLLMRVALASREPALAQLKLAWWRDACAFLPGARGSPLVAELAIDWSGDAGSLIDLIDAWEEAAVQDGSAPEKSAITVADARGAALAQAAGTGFDGRVRAVARRWTLSALAVQTRNDAQRSAFATAAVKIGVGRLPRSLRPLVVLDGLAFRAMQRGGNVLLGDRLSPLAALRLGILGR